MLELIIATKNNHKVYEIESILKGLPLKLISLLDLKDVPKIIENKKTFEGNALKKARIISKKFNELVMADDSGLEVKALDGKPGVKSARFAGPNPTPEKLCHKLLRVMGQGSRVAQFVCCVAIVFPDGKEKVLKGICRGKIIRDMRGKNGFGYDPVFVPAGYKKTFAEMSSLMKNRLSHRGRAFRKAKIALKSAL